MFFFSSCRFFFLFLLLFHIFLVLFISSLFLFYSVIIAANIQNVFIEVFVTLNLFFCYFSFDFFYLFSYDFLYFVFLTKQKVAKKHNCRIFAPSSIAAFGAGIEQREAPDVTAMRPSTIYGVGKVINFKIFRIVFLLFFVLFLIFFLHPRSWNNNEKKNNIFSGFSRSFPFLWNIYYFIPLFASSNLFFF